MHKKHVAILVAGAAIASLLATVAITRSGGNENEQAGRSTVIEPGESEQEPGEEAEEEEGPGQAEEWMTLQRANPDGTIPNAAITEAIAQSKAAGKTSMGSPST